MKRRLRGFTPTFLLLAPSRSERGWMTPAGRCWPEAAIQITKLEIGQAGLSRAELLHRTALAGSSPPESLSFNISRVSHTHISGGHQVSPRPPIPGFVADGLLPQAAISSTVVALLGLAPAFPSVHPATAAENKRKAQHRLLTSTPAAESRHPRLRHPRAPA